MRNQTQIQLRKVLMDIEVYPNFFMCGVENYITKEKKYFEISQYRDDRTELRKWLTDFDGFMITFNGLHYDNVVLGYYWLNEELDKVSTITCCTRLKWFSDQIINAEFIDREYRQYKYAFWNRWGNIDLYLYWSKMLRLSKKISLKGLGIQMGYPVVQELPYSPDLYLDESQIKDIKVYNLEHDLGILDLLMQQFTGKGKISIGNLGTVQLRQHVWNSYDINVMSFDSPKIASEILLKTYCQKTGQQAKDVRGLRFHRPTIRFKDILSDIPVNFKTKVFQDVYNQWLQAVDTFDCKFVCGKEHPVKISVGVGGIHAVNNNEIYESTQTHAVVTDDISSMYPTNIENWNAFRFPEVMSTYVDFKNERLNHIKPTLKKLKKDDPQYNYYAQSDLFHKLLLNGVSGLLDMEHSWLYNPEKIMKVRCGGQLILMQLIENLIEAGFDVISANTDGIETIVERSRMNEYVSIVQGIEKQFKVDFEREIYNKIVYSNVNSYIAITENGKIKKKGQFITDPELGSSCDFLVIPKMLEWYFIQNIKPETVIEDPEKYGLHIYDFCASKKSDRSFQVYWNGKKQQRLNRFFVSNKGAFLYKRKGDKDTHMLKGWGVTLYNNHVEKPWSEYNINKNFYLSEVNKLITEIQNKNQLTLF